MSLPSRHRRPRGTGWESRSHRARWSARLAARGQPRSRPGGSRARRPLLGGLCKRSSSMTLLTPAAALSALHGSPQERSALLDEPLPPEPLALSVRTSRRHR